MEKMRETEMHILDIFQDEIINKSFGEVRYDTAENIFIQEIVIS